MLEAKLDKAELLKKVLDGVKELVTDANFTCSEEGVKLQAMDSSHVALVSMNLPPSIFEENGYRCDRTMSLGMNMGSLQKILRCAGNDDEVTLRADESGDVIILQFSDKQHDRVGEYELKLMDIDQEHLAIPKTKYDAHVTMPSGDFLKIVRDLKELGESVKLEVTKEGIKFTAEGDIGKAAVTLRPTEGASNKKAGSSSRSRVKDEEDDSDDEETNGNKDGDNEDEEEDEEDEDDEGGKKKKKKSKSNGIVKVEDGEEEEGDDDEDEGPKRKSKSKASRKGKSKKRKADEDDEDDDDVEVGRRVLIDLTQAVALTFSIKYLNNFAKSTPLSPEVQLCMSNEVPLLVKYQFGDGHVAYYLAPKISDEA